MAWHWNLLMQCFLTSVGFLNVRGTPTFDKISSPGCHCASTYEQNYVHEIIIIELNNDLQFWIHLIASRGRFDNNQSILKWFINLITFMSRHVWRQSNCAPHHTYGIINLSTGLLYWYVCATVCVYCKVLRDACLVKFILKIQFSRAQA